MLIREEGGQAVYHIQPPAPGTVDQDYSANGGDEGSATIGEGDANVGTKNGSVKVKFDDEDNTNTTPANGSGSGGESNVWGRFMKVFM